MQNNWLQLDFLLSSYPLNWCLFFLLSHFLWISHNTLNCLRTKFQFSLSVVSDSLQMHGLQHVRLPCPSQIPRACSNACPWSRWCYTMISSSIIPFSSCLRFFPRIRWEIFPIISSLHQVAKVLELQHQSFQWIFRIEFLYNWRVWYICSPRNSQESSPTPHF